MKKIVWLKSYSVGVEEFDFHHRKMFSIINQLREVSQSGDQSKLSEILADLSKYAEFHLSKEEVYFNKYQYPGQSEHLKVHNAYRKQMEQIFKEHEQGKLDITRTLDFLKGWWINHILKEDQKYTNFFNDQGIF